MSAIFQNVAPLRVDFDKELLLQKMVSAIKDSDYALRDPIYRIKLYVEAGITDYFHNDSEALRIERIRRRSVGIEREK